MKRFVILVILALVGCEQPKRLALTAPYPDRVTCTQPSAECVGVPGCAIDLSIPQEWGTNATLCDYRIKPETDFTVCMVNFYDPESQRMRYVYGPACLLNGQPWPHDYAHVGPKWWCTSGWLPGCWKRAEPTPTPGSGWFSFLRH